VPRRCAFGYQTLADDSEVSYLIDEAHAPPHERTLRHDDPLLGLSWPLPVAAISARDDGAAPLATWKKLLEREMAPR
jgi:dTDP-4-dehydrorhamnose 3,5-epimerase